VPQPNETEALLELLVQWDELRHQGKTATAQELCPDDPHLQALLQERLARRGRLQAVLDLPDATIHDDRCRPATLPTVAGYEIGDLLGRGGMGVVYKARQTALHRNVALKIVISGASASAEERARFRTEAEAVARLQHANIVQIYEIGEQAGCPYLALEYVGGGSLAQQLDGKPMPPRRAAQLVLDLARAVQHAHEHGIVRRDLKPANVLLTESGVAKIADFGLAKLLDADQSQTQTGAVLGSPSYMAPEQAEGKVRAIGPATDVYALGAVLYELLTGRPPFVGVSLLETLEQVRFHDAVSPQTLQPMVSADLATICLKCLEKRPTQRYASAAALAEDLERYLQGEPIAARRMTLVDHVGRLLRHSQVDVNFSRWATRTLCLAPIPLIAHVAVFVLCRDWPRFPVIALGVTMLTVLVVLCNVLFIRRANWSTVAAAQRRQLQSTWSGHATGFVIVPIAVVLMVQPTTIEQWFVIYAVWLTLAGCTFVTLAARVGFLYITAGVCFLVALTVPFVPHIAPLLAGALMTANMLSQWALMRRLAKEALLDMAVREKGPHTLTPPARKPGPADQQMQRAAHSDDDRSSAT
jgi:serine/threonine protein kinase